MHSNPNSPIWLYSELDDERFETRKVEIYADGHWGYASDTEEVNGTGLGLYAVPSLAEIASNPVFEPFEIGKEEFEDVWSERHKRSQV
jgi:hypothetical protein